MQVVKDCLATPTSPRKRKVLNKKPKAWSRPPVFIPAIATEPPALITGVSHASVIQDDSRTDNHTALHAKHLSWAVQAAIAKIKL